MAKEILLIEITSSLWKRLSVLEFEYIKVITGISYYKPCFRQ